MHDFRRFGCLAASAARASIQPEVEKLTTPAAASRSIWRRDSSGMEWFERFMVFPRIEMRDSRLDDAGDVAPVDVRRSMVKAKFGAIEQGPEDVAERLGAVARRAAAIDVRHELRELAGTRPASERRQIQGLDPPVGVEVGSLCQGGQRLAGLDGWSRWRRAARS